MYSQHYLLSSTAGGSCSSRNTSRLGVAMRISIICNIKNTNSIAFNNSNLDIQDICLPLD